MTNFISQGMSKQAFEDFIKKQQIVFVDFWTNQCAPCKQFGVIFEKVATEAKDITFVKLNLDDLPHLAEMFQIFSVPHLMVFKEGIAIYSESGSIPMSTLQELVQQARDVDVSDIKLQLSEGEDSSC